MQVKIYGRTVDIPKIENIIQNFKLTDEFAVLCHTFSRRSMVIVAYYNTFEKERSVALEFKILDTCRLSLPVVAQYFICRKNTLSPDR